jgi:hypothetical protein
MKLARLLLGFLWTLAAAVPLAAPAEVHGDAGVAGVSAPGRGPRPESRASLGAVRIGLGELVLRDLKTPFIGTPSFRLDTGSITVTLEDHSVPRSDGQAVRHSHYARPPPVLP